MGSESNPLVNFVIGLLVGGGATFLYIRFGIELPAATGVGQRITSEAIVKTAEFELFNASNPPLVRHRALAVILANEPEKFLAIDQAINHRFLNEFLRQHQSGFPLNGPVVLNPPKNDLTTINKSKVGTTIVNSRGVLGTPTIGVKTRSNFVTEALLRQKNPNASDEIIKFLLAHPDIRSSTMQIGRQATLPGVKMKIGTGTESAY